MVQVAFVAIGATMVGSITFLKNKGDYVRKGDEVSFILCPCDYLTVACAVVLVCYLSNSSSFLLVWVFLLWRQHSNLRV